MTTIVQIMLEPTPFRNLHEEYAESLRAQWNPTRGAAGDEGSRPPFEVEYLPYGPSQSGSVEGSDSRAVEIVGTYGPVEAEYAAIRRGAGIIDRAQRAVIRVAGSDRLEFLNRLLTQELRDLAPGKSKQSFWLNRKGRIEADLLVIAREKDIFLDLDRHQRDATAASLGSFVFTEEVDIAPLENLGRMAVHGRRSIEAVAHAADMGGPLLIAHGDAAEIVIAGRPATVVRNDEAGEPGLEIFAETAGLETVWRALIESDAALAAGARRIRPIGWHAYNIARIEAGTALMNVDFGPTNLPHETGILRERVSLTKGCYLGQEVVARMEHLGKPKQVLVGLRMRSDGLPVAGAQVFSHVEGSPGEQVGVITSSTLSPMLGAIPIAFGMVRTRHADPGTTLIVNAEGQRVEAAVHALRFWPE